jgi:hypothetical protein
MSNLATIVNNILADSGIDDINVVVTTGSYTNPAWIVSLPWTKITGTPTTLAGYGITDAYTQTQVNNLLAGYLPLTGGTLTGPLVGTSASFNSNINTTNGSVTIKTAAFGGLLNLQSGATIDNWQLYHYTIDNTLRFNYNGAGGDEFVLTTAGNASVSGTFTASSIIRAGGTSSQYLMADGSVSTLANPVTGTGSIGQVAFWNGTTTQTGDNGLFWDNVNKRLGIGTNVPTAGLEVNGRSILVRSSINQSITLYNNGTVAANIGGTLFFRGTYRNVDFDNVAYASVFGGKENGIDSNFAGYLSFSTYTHAGSFSERVRIDSLGNVGIATPIPTNKLQIGSVGSTGYSGNDIAIGNGTQVMAFAQTAAYSAWFTNTNFVLFPAGSGGIGNLLVGLISDNGARLQVGGNGTFSGSVTTTNLLTTSMSGSAINIRGNETLNSPFGITWTTPTYTGGLAAIRVQRTGAADASDMIFYVSPNGDIPNERVRIDSNGLVTIGTGATTGTTELLRLRRNASGWGNTTFKQSYNSTFFTNGKTLTLANDSNTDFAHFAGNNSGTVTNFYLPTGSIGIGVNAAARKLDIRVTPVSNADDGIFINDGVGDFLLVRTGSAYTYRGVPASASMVYSNTALAFLSDNPSGRISFHNNSGEYARFTSVGRFLLGNVSSDNGARLQVDGAATFSSSVTALDFASSPQGLNVSGYGFLSQTLSGQMTILGHNVRASGSVNNQVNIVNGGWISSMIKQYYNDGITFHTDTTMYSAGAVYPMAATERMRIDSFGAITMATLAGSGNRIVVANSSGRLISAVIGSGLAFDGTTLTATGGSSGSISGSGTSGIIPVFSGASSISNSIVQATSAKITVVSNTAGQIIEMARSGGAYNWKLGMTSSSIFSIYNNENTSMLELDPSSANMTLGSGQNVKIRLGRNTSDWGEVEYTGGATRLRNGWDNTSAYIEQLVNNQSTRLYGSGILDQNRTSEGTHYRFQVDGNNRMIIGTDGSSNALIRTGNGVDLRLGVNEDAITIKNGGNVIVGGTTNSGFKFDVQGSAYINGDFRVQGIYRDYQGEALMQTNTSAVTLIGSAGASTARSLQFLAGNSTRLTIASSGAATFTSSVTASSFFESSDLRLKSDIMDLNVDMSSILAKKYIKDGKEEVGYIAQDVETILSSAVSKREDGYLDLSYRQIHTAKIAYLEKRITELEQQLKNK